jgi:serine/threonine protein kinase
MTLASGSKLGPYEIVGPLGTGGMGEVYRARDKKLGRDVAIKVLPREFAADPARMARFEREAKLLASLNRKCAHRKLSHQRGAVEAIVYKLCTRRRV